MALTKNALELGKMDKNDVSREMEDLVAASSEHRHGSNNNELSSRRIQALAGLSLLVVLFFFQHVSPSSTSEVSITLTSDTNSTIDEAAALSLSDVEVESANSSGATVTEAPSPSSSKDAIITKKSTALAYEKDSADEDDSGGIICQVPATGSDKKAPKLTSESAATAFANCSSHIGKRITKSQRKQVARLPKNKNAHIFSFPSRIRNTDGQRPLLCVPPEEWELTVWWARICSLEQETCHKWRWRQT